MACSTSCPTQNHRTYGECLRSKGLSTASGDTTKASPPTKPNDALTAKAAPRFFPCALHRTTADPECDYCTTTTEDMIRATKNPVDLTGSKR